MYSIFATLKHETVKFYFKATNKVIIIVEYLRIKWAVALKFL